MELEKLNVFIEINGVNQLVGNISGILSGNAVLPIQMNISVIRTADRFPLVCHWKRNHLIQRERKIFLMAYYRKGLQEPALHIGCIRKNRIIYLFCMD